MVEGVHAIHCLVAWFIQQQERSGNGHAQSQPPPPPVVVTLLLGVCVFVCVNLCMCTHVRVLAPNSVYLCVFALCTRVRARVSVCVCISNIYVSWLGMPAHWERIPTNTPAHKYTHANGFCVVRFLYAVVSAVL